MPKRLFLSLLFSLCALGSFLPQLSFAYFDSLKALENQSASSAPLLTAYASPTSSSPISLPGTAFPQKTIEALSKPPSPQSSLYILSEKAVKEEIRRQLQEKYALEGELKIFLNKAFQDLPLKTEHWELEITQCPPDKLSDKFLLSFHILNGPHLLGQWQLPVRAELWKDAYISLRYIRRGENLYDRDFKTHPVDVLRMRGRSVSTHEDLSDYIAEQNVPQNDVLIYHDIKRKPDVIKGQLVDVVAEDYGIRIQTKAKALQDGIKGECISVQNLQSKKNIQGQIIGDNLVKVHF